jgi:hypothetical protein
MNTQEMIAIKAQYQNEIRRFSLPAKSTFETLETNLKNLFSLSGSPVIKYTDDERDLCTISTQREFDFALTLNQDLLRVQIFTAEVPQIAPAQPVAASPMCSGTVDQPKDQQKKNCWLEKIDNKQAALVAKRDCITSKLADETLNAERRRVLNWKLEKIQEKINFFEARKRQIAENPQEHWKGGRGRGGHGPQRFHPHGPHHEHPHGPHHEHPHGPHHEHPHGFPPHGPHPHHGPHHEEPPKANEWMEKRQLMLNSKRDLIKTKLADEKITPERKEILNAKLLKFEEKIYAFETRKQHCAQGGRGGRRGCGRGAQAEFTPK